MELVTVQTIIGAVIAVVLTFVANRSGKILDRIDSMRNDMTLMRKDIDNQGEKVNLLYNDYNRRRDQELQELRNTVRDYESR